MDYLKFSREFSKLSPGFETDIHGLVEIEDEHGVVRYYADCVAEAPQPKPGRRGGKKDAPAAESIVQVGSDGPFGRTL